MTDERTDALLDWYRSTRRDLPWRRTTDPWAVLVSEVMLQQTQASRVIPAFERFLERFPTVEQAAAAPLADLLECWSGLGYNNRVRRLHDTARRVTTEGWPTTVDGLLDLPGVGPYTAAAVACFAFGEPVPTVDTNMRRVVSRWLGLPLQGRALVEAADRLLPEHAAYEWNQAVMELGATFCRPAPACSDCPVAPWCVDPSVYVPPPAQTRFEGSRRQLRGAVLRTLLQTPGLTVDQLAARLDADPARVAAAASALVADGLLTDKADGLAPA